MAAEAWSTETMKDIIVPYIKELLERHKREDIKLEYVNERVPVIVDETDEVAYYMLVNGKVQLTYRGKLLLESAARGIQRNVDFSNDTTTYDSFLKFVGKYIVLSSFLEIHDLVTEADK